MEYAWDNFDVKEVTSILTSPQKSYSKHKDILFAGLCAWVACPSKPVLVKHAITLTAARFFNQGERAGPENFDNIPQIGDIYIRMHEIGYRVF